LTNENPWKVIINNDSEYVDKEKFKIEFLNITSLSESDIEIEKDLSFTSISMRVYL